MTHPRSQSWLLFPTPIPAMPTALIVQNFPYDPLPSCALLAQPSFYHFLHQSQPGLDQLVPLLSGKQSIKLTSVNVLMHHGWWESGGLEVRSPSLQVPPPVALGKHFSCGVPVSIRGSFRVLLALVPSVFLTQSVTPLG